MAMMTMDSWTIRPRLSEGLTSHSTQRWVAMETLLPVISVSASAERRCMESVCVKRADLRLCRLCFVNKFADGIGRVCVDCKRRVCHECGSFSRRDVSDHEKAKVSDSDSVYCIS